jgi:hypothetical protein
MGRPGTKQALELISIWLFYLVLTVSIPLALIYGLGAAENNSNLVKFFLYTIIGLPVVIFSLIRVYLKNRGYFEANPELKGFDFLTIHSPQQTFLGKRFEWIRSPVRLTAVFLVVGMMLGALVSQSGQFAPGVPVLVQGSVAESTTALGLAVEPAVSAETLFFNVGLLMSTTAVLMLFLIRNGMDPGAAVVASKTVSVVTTTLAFLFYHNFRYGAAETSQVGILLLGFITNVLTAVTHSIIPAYMIHGSGNLFEKASSAGIFANDVAVAVALIGALVGIFVLGFIFILDS